LTSGTPSDWDASESHKYPILSLPPEILTEVFINFLPSYPDYPPLHGIFSPLLLCQICRQWRAVALSTPLLWRAIQVELTRGTSDKQLAAQLELLKTWLQRSGNCPLSLSLTHARNITHRLVPQFLRAVMAHCQRWEHLDVLMPFEHMHLLHGDMPLLRTLTFGPSNFPHGRRSRFAQTPFHAAPPTEARHPHTQFFHVSHGSPLGAVDASRGGLPLRARMPRNSP
jgi:hypothetical protein